MRKICSLMAFLLAISGSMPVPGSRNKHVTRDRQQLAWV
ncbi:hypothetical protein ACVWZL_008811 [Bradyrhizobium sp. GM2.4]